eukprot:4925619-Alexandrium_andersonii.AAC.1
MPGTLPHSSRRSMRPSPWSPRCPRYQKRGRAEREGGVPPRSSQGVCGRRASPVQARLRRTRKGARR